MAAFSVRKVVMGEEVWKPISGYEEQYEISSLGNLRSLDRHEQMSDGRTRFRRGKMMSTQVKKNTGYVAVNLYKDGKAKTYLVHRLVAEAFIPNPGHKKEVNHKSGDKTDNSVQNLEWMTSSENTRHSYDVLGRRGSCVGRFTQDQIREIRADERVHRLIAADYGVSRSLIDQIKERKIYKEVS